MSKHQKPPEHFDIRQATFTVTMTANGDGFDWEVSAKTKSGHRIHNHQFSEHPGFFEVLQSRLAAASVSVLEMMLAAPYKPPLPETYKGDILQTIAARQATIPTARHDRSHGTSH